MKVINTNTHTHKEFSTEKTLMFSLSGDILETSDLQIKVNKVLETMYILFLEGQM